MADDGIRVLYSQEEIGKRVHELSKQITSDYNGKKPVIIGILKGSFIFLSDLLRKLYASNLKDVEVDFMTVSSYGQEKTYSGTSTILHDLTVDIKGKDVLIVEDIIDSGYTLKFIREYLQQKNPQSIKIVTLLDKKERREVDVPVSYTGFVLAGSPWVEGYGLDGGLYGRGRPEIVEKIHE